MKLCEDPRPAYTTNINNEACTTIKSMQVLGKQQMINRQQTEERGTST